MYFRASLDWKQNFRVSVAGSTFVVGEERVMAAIHTDNFAVLV